MNSRPIVNPSPGACRGATAILDSDHPTIVSLMEKTVDVVADDPRTRAVKLYYAVRDGIWYDPYSPFYLPEHYRASNVLKRGRGYCVGKASLLCALGRAAGIPSRVGFAAVKNHLITKQLLEFMGTNLFVYHGYVEFYLYGKWVKATPAFNKELCERHGTPPLEFNGRDDSLLQPFNLKEERFLEYVEDFGTFSDIPVETIVEAWRQAYGRERVDRWIEILEASGGESLRNFLTEDVMK